jgi:aryl-alcohol dehydrogenase-like predicted oxidoreductase
VESAEILSENDFRRRNPRFQGDNLKKNLENLFVIRQIAAKHNATPAQVAIAWVLAQGEDIIPIPGTKRVKYLEENIAAAKLPLTMDELTQLASIHAYGERYPEAGQRYLQV